MWLVLIWRGADVEDVWPESKKEEVLIKQMESLRYDPVVKQMAKRCLTIFCEITVSKKTENECLFDTIIAHFDCLSIKKMPQSG